MTLKRWLMKAEPDSRIVKGKDVKFSVDDFEELGRTPWEGVRNHEAKNLMKEMKVGDKVLFYHSNCKNPGVAGFAEVCQEAYPDHTAWDPDHPYYDPKTDKSDPRWHMVDLQFTTRAKHFVSLALIKRIASGPDIPPPDSDYEYIGKDGIRAIKSMALVNRGRLSVQRVEEDAWDTVSMLAEKGGWGENVSGQDDKTKSVTKSNKALVGDSTAKGGVRRSGRGKGKEKAGEIDNGAVDARKVPAKQSQPRSRARAKGDADGKSPTAGTDKGKGRKRKQAGESGTGMDDGTPRTEQNAREGNTGNEVETGDTSSDLTELSEEDTTTKEHIPATKKRRTGGKK